jgi:predicted lipoprotein with Yx(FWY)xxD motif
MRRERARTIGVLLAIGVTACGGEDAAEDAEKSTAAESAPAAPPPAASPPAAPPPAAPATTGVRLSVGRTPEHGSYLTDASGRALYLLEEDARGSSTCYDACIGLWPPLFAAGGAPATAADSAVQARLIGTAPRRDGTSQVTYGGHPLYYYAGDRGPGQTLGQHVEDAWGEWYLVHPGGGKVEDRRGGRGRGRDDDG